MLTLLLLLSNASAEKLSFKYFWESRPTVHICPDATIDEEDVKKAISYWNEQGINAKVRDVKEVSYCSTISKNVIQIMGDRDIRSGELGATVIDWYYYGQQNKDTTYYIDRAKVQIPTGTSQKIIYHEIGHALGLGHSNHNVMYAYH